MVGLNGALNYECGAVFAEKAVHYEEIKLILWILRFAAGTDGLSEQPDHAAISAMSEKQKQIGRADG